MSDSSNTFSSLKPLLKDSYANKIKKLAEKPNNKKYFSFLKKKLHKK